FTRLLSPRERTTGLLNGALSLGDSWQTTNDLRFTYGLRFDAGTFTNRPAGNALVARTFGVANDQLPTPLAFSPRLGFSWTVGRAREVSGFSGAARTPRAVIRGGVGVFASGLSTAPLAAALDNTGLADATRQLTCVGSAAPAPEWVRYELAGSTIPRQCADGSAGSVFASSAPAVSLMSKSFTGPRSARANLAWNGSILDNRLALGLEGIYSLNLHQQRSVDLNFGDATRFTLGDDGRPVFVSAGSIVPSTGTVAAQDGRLSQAFARVIEQRSDLRSRSGQLQLSLSPAARGPRRFGWSASYTLSRMRAQLDGFRSTAGDPLALDWRSEPTGHDLRYNLRYELFDAVTVSWNGWFRSGYAYTPVVSGDINGDGYANDRAFVPDPARTDDPALAAGMRSLLASAPAAVRRCLERQAGRIAGASSCRGPWTSGAWLNLSLDRAKFRMPERGSISFSVANPLGAADLLLHGEGNLHGWGQATVPDPTLLYVRGFDPASRRYRYDVNPRFGATRPQLMTMRAPVVLTAMVRLDIGPTRERQLLDEEIAARRRPSPVGPSSFASGVRNLTTRSIRNPLATILEKQDSLGLTTFQADSVAAMNSRFTYRADSLWAPVVRALERVDSTADAGRLSRQYLETRGALIDMLTQMGPAARALLTGQQRRKLPAAVSANLDPHSLALVRRGTPTYVGGVDSGGDMYEVVS
ncbi:MAG TPA: hypothetical protein VF832_20165, partial [Longimicrobiales bacterium]